MNVIVRCTARLVIERRYRAIARGYRPHEEKRIRAGLATRPGSIGQCLSPRVPGPRPREALPAALPASPRLRHNARLAAGSSGGALFSPDFHR
jgi:hypothetical protein